MDLTLTRNTFFPTTTLGVLSVDGKLECYTLEDRVRVDPNPETPQNEAKVYGETAIPEGRYRVVINMSPKFKKLMMRLLDVPGFTGILIHGGNKHQDTFGCILVGQAISGETIKPGTSTPAVRALFNKVQAALNKGEEVWITITSEVKP